MDQPTFEKVMGDRCRKLGMNVHFYGGGKDFPLLMILTKDQRMAFVYVTDEFPVEDDIPDFIEVHELGSKKWFPTSGAMFNFLETSYNRGSIQNTVALARKEWL